MKLQDFRIKGEGEYTGQIYRNYDSKDKRLVSEQQVMPHPQKW